MAERLETLISETELLNRIDSLAEEIRRDYGDEPILLVGVLKGSYLFLADLSRRLGGNVSIDFVQLNCR